MDTFRRTQTDSLYEGEGRPFRFLFLSLSYILVERLLRQPAAVSPSSISRTSRLWQPADDVFFHTFAWVLCSVGKVLYHLFAILRSFRYMHMDSAFVLGILMFPLLPYSHLVLTSV
jgi:hypothetical protein